MPKRYARTSISNLAAILNSFKPILVNEKFTGKFMPKDSVTKPPDLNEVLHAIGNAMLEIRAFIEEHEEVLGKYAIVKGQAMSSGAQLGSLPFLAGKPLDEGAEILVARFRQCFDFISHVEQTCTDRKTAEAATKFLEPVRKDAPSPIVEASSSPGLQLLSDPPPGEGEDTDTSLDHKG